MEPNLKIAPFDLLVPAFVPPREVTKFRDWCIGCRVVSAVYGDGIVKAFKLTDLSATVNFESQRVEWVEVNFEQVGLKQMPPNTRDLKLMTSEPRPFSANPA